MAGRHPTDHPDGPIQRARQSQRARPIPRADTELPGRYPDGRYVRVTWP